MTSEQLVQKAKYIRKRAFEVVLHAGKGHLGGSLSSTELLVALYYGGILNFDPNNPMHPDRDRFIMSKGHSNNTLYVILADLGLIKESDLDSYTQDGSLLGGHCDSHVSGIEIISGSLGHGLGVAAGIALGAKLDSKEYRIYVIIGDGESQEGSVWEAAMFAAHHKLSNLIAITDRNLLGSEEFTENNAGLEPLADKWKAFGWEVTIIQDGHSIEQVINILRNLEQTGKPRMIIAQTIKGKGISSLENTPQAHHTLPKGEFIAQAIEELGR
ncbi:transketolase [Trichlorobacter thiogenes]|uniref:Transketolase n=1 Tax=Trichlorobacter thiogenes TaxID=115783 RepID=A0A1T4JX35_9BACT|nr:transketolase [Trichlorobacter thiogenes]SJZ34709.1 transketolase [Trichlorobacter thiogenes]